MEPWDFGNPGWVNEKAAGFITAPVTDSLVFEVLAWTPGTNGVVSANALRLEVPRRPTQTEFNKWMDSYREKVKGKIVLVGSPRRVPVNFRPRSKRLSDAQLKPRGDRRSQARRAPARAAASPTPTPREPRLSFRAALRQLDKFLIDSGAKLRINDAGRPHGQVRAFHNRTFDVTKTVPTVVMRNEDYGRIWRILAGGKPVTLEFYIRNRVYPAGATSYNVIGEIAGRGSKKDEVIMLGGHLDSWHSATGATDNAIGCSIMMEAARILKTIGVKPKRTIRVALWSGEEQGLLGSRAYVKRHFGSFENPTPAFAKFGGYFNIDSGTGRARAMSVFGPPEAARILNEATASFKDLKFVAVANTASRRLGGSDHTSFNQAGLPGIGVRQDPIEYFSHTWHTNLDTYERIVEEDVKASAAVVAAAVYELATRDELLPRLTKKQMPPSTIRPR